MHLTVDFETERGISAVEKLVKITRGKLTVYVTGELLEQHADKLDFLRKCDAQLHGYHHIPLAYETPEKQNLEISQAKRVYQNFFGFQPWGWRSPYLTFSHVTLRILHEKGFLWDSSYVHSPVTWLRRLQSPIYLIPIDSKGFNEKADTVLVHCYELTEPLLERIKRFSGKLHSHSELYASRRRFFK